MIKWIIKKKKEHNLNTEGIKNIIEKNRRYTSKFNRK